MYVKIELQQGRCRLIIAQLLHHISDVIVIHAMLSTGCLSL